MKFSQAKFTLEQMETIAGVLEQAAMEERLAREHRFKVNLADKGQVLIDCFPGLIDGMDEVSGADLVEFLSGLAGEK